MSRMRQPAYAMLPRRRPALKPCACGAPLRGKGLDRDPPPRSRF